MIDLITCYVDPDIYTRPPIKRVQRDQGDHRKKTTCLCDVGWKKGGLGVLGAGYDGQRHIGSSGSGISSIIISPHESDGKERLAGEPICREIGVVDSFPSTCYCALHSNSPCRISRV